MRFFTECSLPVTATLTPPLKLAGLWVNLCFGRSYALEKSVLTHPSKLKELAKLCAGSGEVMVILTLAHVILSPCQQGYHFFTCLSNYLRKSPKYYPEDKNFLLEFEPTVTHYEVW